MSGEDLQCIECGQSAPELYRKFPGGVIKVAQCPGCGHVVDKYIEYEPVLVLLDAILHRKQAYRHLLHNSSLQWCWKLLLLLLFCDAYERWEAKHLLQTNTIVNAAVELDFYLMLAKATIDWIVFTFSLWCLLNGAKYFSRGMFDTGVSLQPLVRCLTISSFGKLLVLPASIWGQSQTSLCWWLTKLFIFSSNNAALRAQYRCPDMVLMGILALAHLSQQFVFLHVTT